MSSIIKVNTYQDANGNALFSSDGSGNVTLSAGDFKSTPAFQVKLSGNQSISSASHTKIQFNQEIFDTDTAYDNATNYRFTIPSGEGGKYFVYAQAQMNTSAYIELKMDKNGSELFRTHDADSAVNNSRGLWIGGVDIASASDYYEVYFFQASGSSQNVIGNNSRTFFGAYKLIGA
jgi:hypothetical protein